MIKNLIYFTLILVVSCTGRKPEAANVTPINKSSPNPYRDSARDNSNINQRNRNLDSQDPFRDQVPQPSQDSRLGQNQNQIQPPSLNNNTQPNNDSIDLRIRPQIDLGQNQNNNQIPNPQNNGGNINFNDNQLRNNLITIDWDGTSFKCNSMFCPELVE